MTDLISYYEEWNRKLDNGNQPAGIRSIQHLRENETDFFRSHRIAAMPHPRNGLLQKHDHDFYEFNYVLRGNCKNYVDRKEIILNQGDMLLMNTNAWHIAECMNKQTDIVYNLLVSTSLMKEVQVYLNTYHDVFADFFLAETMHKKDADNYLVFRADNPDAGYRIIVEHMLTNFLDDDLYMDAMLNSLFRCLLIELVRNHRSSVNTVLKKNSPVSYHVSLQKLVEYIEKNSGTVTLESVSAQFGYSADYLSHLFQESCGMNFSSFVQKLRIRKAQQLLLTTDLTVSEIMDVVGYQNRTWFCRKFHESFGMNPKEYRDKRMDYRP